MRCVNTLFTLYMISCGEKRLLSGLLSFFFRGKVTRIDVEVVQAYAYMAFFSSGILFWGRIPGATFVAENLHKAFDVDSVSFLQDETGSFVI